MHRPLRASLSAAVEGRSEQRRPLDHIAAVPDCQVSPTPPSAQPASLQISNRGRTLVPEDRPINCACSDPATEVINQALDDWIQSAQSVSERDGRILAKTCISVSLSAGFSTLELKYLRLSDLPPALTSIHQFTCLDISGNMIGDFKTLVGSLPPECQSVVIASNPVLIWDMERAFDQGTLDKETLQQARSGRPIPVAILTAFAAG
jgi:hypothetical protein